MTQPPRPSHCRGNVTPRLSAGPHSPFTPLQESGTGSDNLLYTGNPGQLFNPGNGLGLPNMSQLAADFAG